MSDSNVKLQEIQARQDFLKMSITPNFDAIPQIMKDLTRWLCWQLQPADPKPKKVPMTPKNGKLVNAAVNKPENWLTFDEAISLYQRGLCSGIGFALTNQHPRVCCIDVDHCFNPDGSLTAEAQAVIDAHPNCYVEISQSGTGIHIWFIDEEFKGGRRGGNVEVYAADRYIAVTGVRVQSSANDLPVVNGLCSKVIAKFIDVREENLFDVKTARATDEKINIDVSFETNLPMTDDDRRLIEYFHSEKCLERDPNAYDLFAGNVEEYFKRKNKPADDSVADNDLMLKILYYIGGSGTDAEIGQRALKLFNQSGLAKREKWQARADYRRRTLNKAWGFWVKNGRKAYSGNQLDSAQNSAQETLNRREELLAKLKELQELPMSNDIVSQIRRILHKLCHWAHDKTGNPTKIKPDVYNYKLIFDNDPNLKNLFGRDDFRQETIFLRRAIWHNADAPLKDSWDDTDDAELRLYLAENYAEMSNPQRTFDFIIRVARENSFHSIKKFFKGLPKWDGVPRMKKLFVKFLGADNTEYTHEVTRHALLGAIARAFYPGCDFQSVVVLQGPQGIGKSRVIRMLGGKHGVNKGENWHVALRDQLDDSHAVDAMRKGWIVEIEEFAAGSRADVNAMKGVLSADDVTRRFAYDRRAKTIKAHWTFFATCNDDAPLRDQTGNRRFLPIKCKNKQSHIVEGMTADYIQQVWAEALVEFKKLFPTVDDFDDDKLRLSPEIQAQAAAQAENITQDDGLTTEIKGYLDKKILPPVIWYLLSREERHKFFVEGGKFQIEKDDLKARFKNRAGKKYNELKKEFEIACTVREGFLRHFTDKDNRWQLIFYGSELRQHICAAEIFNECFGSDNRKRITRINTILSMLDGWHLGERIQKADPTYKDQKKVYYRDKDNCPVEESNKPAPAQSTPPTFDPDDTPF